MNAFEPRRENFKYVVSVHQTMNDEMIEASCLFKHVGRYTNVFQLQSKPRKNTYIRLTMLLGQEKKLRDLLPLRERSDKNFTVHHFDRYNNNHQHPTSFNYSNSVTSSQFRMVFCVFACDAPIFNFPFKTKHKKILSLVVSTSST